MGEEKANETKKTAALAPAATSTRKKTSPTSLPFILSFSSSLVLPTRAACLSWGARQKRLFCLSCLFLDAPFLLSNPGGVLKGYGYLSICLFFLFFFLSFSDERSKYIVILFDFHFLFIFFCLFAFLCCPPMLTNCPLCGSARLFGVLFCVLFSKRVRKWQRKGEYNGQKWAERATKKG